MRKLGHMREGDLVFFVLTIYDFLNDIGSTLHNARPLRSLFTVGMTSKWESSIPTNLCLGGFSIRPQRRKQLAHCCLQVSGTPLVISNCWPTQCR